MRGISLNWTKIFQIIFYSLCIILPFLFYAQDIIAGEIPFWYDPARDFMMGLSNLHHPTLIGPTSGIPGIFYGPYWIWLISLGVVFTPDPRFTAILIGAIPYLVVFPLLLLGFLKIYKYSTIVIMWLLFLIEDAGLYATNLWNPHIAPVLFLFYCILILYTDFSKTKILNLIRFAVLGFVLGLIINFHISFGIGVACGSYVWLFSYTLIYKLKKSKERKFLTYALYEIKILVSFSFGLLCSFLPFFAFESRHGFNQIKVAIHTLTAHGAVVSQKGMTHGEILSSFFSRGGNLLSISSVLFGAIVGISLIILIGIIHFKKIKVSQKEIQIISFVITIGISILFIYMTSKNPVWSYHFISVEVIFLVLIGFVINKSIVLRAGVGVWVLILFYHQIPTIRYALTNNPLESGNLAAKMNAVNKVYQDAGNNQFEVYYYSPSIYIYDYAYLFDWLGNKQVSYKPEDVPLHQKLVYVILPPDKSTTLRDFVEYRTSSQEYKTTKKISIPDGTLILRREKINSK